MNQFNHIFQEEKLKKISEVWITANNFDYILNNIWSIYSFTKGKSKWLEIKSNISEPFRTKISIEIGHVEIGHGIIQSRLAVKDEMEKYIQYLINKNMS
jgi:hypothetical protein